jgi:hypothetical protein
MEQAKPNESLQKSCKFFILLHTAGIMNAPGRMCGDPASAKPIY